MKITKNPQKIGQIKKKIMIFTNKMEFFDQVKFSCFLQRKILRRKKKDISKIKHGGNTVECFQILTCTQKLFLRKKNKLLS